MKLSITQIITAAALTAWLAGCGTQPQPTPNASTPPGSNDPISAQSFPEPVLPITANTTGAAAQGYWSPTEPWPLVAIHASLLPNGDVMTWDMSGEDGFTSGPNIAGSWDYQPSDGKSYVRRVDLWNPRLGIGSADPTAHSRVDNFSTNLFCSGHVLLPDGNLFVVGGHIPILTASGVDQNVGGGTKDTNVFDWRTNTWAAGAKMNKARWYASATVLGDGGVMVAGGHDETATNVTAIEIFRNGLFGLPLKNSDTTGGASYYPRLFQASNGRVFYAGLQTDMYSIDPTDVGTTYMPYAGSRDGLYRSYGSTVMFERDKILVANGQQPVDPNAIPPVTSIGYTNSSYVVDLSSSTTTPTINAVPSGGQPLGRFQQNATILADGSVLVTGGNNDPNGTQNSPTNAALTPVLFTPNANATNGTWTNMADMTQSRQYHSVALLMPDGRVFTAGSGNCTRQGCTDLSDRSHEFFWPPYLFNADGTLARRPKIVNAPSSVRYGQRIRISTPDAGSITKVTWVRLGSVTHADNMNQRSMTLTFTRSGDTLLVNAPADDLSKNPPILAGNVAPPGHYMLFAINANGTPSTARIIRIDN